MGIDYSACYADVVEWQHVQLIAPKATGELIAVLARYAGDETVEYLLEALAQTVHEDLSGDPARGETPYELLGALGCYHDDHDAAAIAREILNSFVALCAEFRLNTTVGGRGLELGIGYHDSQGQGCRGDEIDGVYYSIAGGAWQLTPAGQRFRNKFARKHFTTWS